MRTKGSIYAAFGALILGACSIIPDTPPDFALPVQEILAQTACELRTAFNALDTKEFKKFDAKHWLVTVDLKPKTDTDLNGNIGFTRKHPYIGTDDHSTVWNVSGPGLQLEGKGERAAGVSYKFDSSKLMADKKLQCPTGPSVHALAQHLGVGEWLTRTASAMKVAPSASIDTPTYNSEINVKFAGNGSYTFTFPPGTDLVGFGGSYTLDELLNIGMAPIKVDAPITVTTLPEGGGAFQPKVTYSSGAVASAQNRLDLLRIEQAISNLQPR